MDVLLDDVVAAEPDEMIPVVHLIFHFGHLGLRSTDPNSRPPFQYARMKVMSPIAPSWIF